MGKPKWVELRRWADALLVASSNEATRDEDAPIRAYITFIAGFAAFQQGDYARAIPLLEEAVEVSRAAAEPRVLGLGLLMLAFGRQSAAIWQRGGAC